MPTYLVIHSNQDGTYDLASVDTDTPAEAANHVKEHHDTLEVYAVLWEGGVKGTPIFDPHGNLVPMSTEDAEEEDMEFGELDADDQPEPVEAHPDDGEQEGNPNA